MSNDTTQSALDRMMGDMPPSVADHLRAAVITHSLGAVTIRAANPQSAAWLQAKLAARLKHDFGLYVGSAVEVIIQ